MKNKFLLLSATAILSTGLAFGVLAVEGKTTSLTTEVALFRPWSIEQVSALDFGSLIPENKGEIVISTVGGYTTEMQTLNDDSSRKQGQIRIKGMHADTGRYSSAAAKDPGDLQSLASVFILDRNWLAFSDPQPLTDKVDSSIICGTTPVESFTQSAEYDDKGILINIGAKLVLADDIVTQIDNVNRSIQCEGSVTVTNIVNDDLFQE